MVASRQEEFPFLKKLVENVDQSFSELVKVFRRAATPFFASINCLSCKTPGCWLLDFAVPKFADAFIDKKTSRRRQRVREDKLWENSSVVVAGKRLQAQAFQENLENEPVDRWKIILQTFLNNLVI